jgi:hypothetical protein
VVRCQGERSACNVRPQAWHGERQLKQAHQDAEHEQWNRNWPENSHSVKHGNMGIEQAPQDHVQIGRIFVDCSAAVIIELKRREQGEQAHSNDVNSDEGGFHGRF